MEIKWNSETCKIESGPNTDKGQLGAYEKIAVEGMVPDPSVILTAEKKAA